MFSPQETVTLSSLALFVHSPHLSYYWSAAEALPPSTTSAHCTLAEQFLTHLSIMLACPQKTSKGFNCTAAYHVNERLGMAPYFKANVMVIFV